MYAQMRLSAAVDRRPKVYERCRQAEQVALNGCRHKLWLTASPALARALAPWVFYGAQLASLEKRLSEIPCDVEGWILLGMHLLPRARDSATAVLDTLKVTPDAIAGTGLACSRLVKRTPPGLRGRATVPPLLHRGKASLTRRPRLHRENLGAGAGRQGHRRADGRRDSQACPEGTCPGPGEVRAGQSGRAVAHVPDALLPAPWGGLRCARHGGGCSRVSEGMGVLGLSVRPSHRP